MTLLASIAVDTVTVLTYPTTGDHGAQVINYSATPARRDIKGCSWQPSDGSELYDRQDATRAAGRLFLPSGSGITGTSIIEVRGLEYEVVGDPADNSGAPFGLGHVVAVLQRWEG